MGDRAASNRWSGGAGSVAVLIGKHEKGKMMSKVDYTKAAHKLGSLCEDDASKWATAFYQFRAKHGFPADEENMLGWFANAIEIAHDHRIAIRAGHTIPDAEFGSTWIADVDGFVPFVPTSEVTAYQTGFNTGLEAALNIAHEHCPAIPHDGPVDKIQEAEYSTAGLIISDIRDLISDGETAARPISVSDAAKVLLDDRLGGCSNRKAMRAMWDYVHEQYGRHMLPVSAYDGVFQAALRALAEQEGGE